jgi:hypothetical protein
VTEVTISALNPLNPNPQFCGHDIITILNVLKIVTMCTCFQHRRLLIDGIAVHFGTAGQKQSQSFQSYLRLITGQSWCNHPRQKWPTFWIFVISLTFMHQVYDRILMYIYADLHTFTQTIDGFNLNFC